MTKYMKGKQYEQEVINIFKDNGYKTIRSAGSKGQWDVVLIKETEKNKRICFVAFVQCKIKKK